MKTNPTKGIRLIVGGLAGMLLLSLCCVQSAPAQEPLISYELQYFDNTVGPNVVNFFNPKIQTVEELQLVCEMIYVFDAHEEMQACCGCPVTNDGTRRVRVDTGLLAKPLGGNPVPNGVIKVVTTDFNQSSGAYAPCNPAAINSNSSFESPTPAWVTHVGQFTIPFGTFKRTTESDFENSPLGSGELNLLAQSCTFIHRNGTGNGICQCGIGDSVAPTPGSGGR